MIASVFVALLSGCGAEPAPAPEAKATELIAPTPRAAPLPPGDPGRAAEWQKLTDLAKASLQETKQLSRDLKKAYETGDSLWYDSELKHLPMRRMGAWREAEDRIRLTDEDKSIYNPCALAVSMLRNTYEAFFEQGSQHYAEHWMKRFREDLAECESVVELGPERYNALVAARVEKALSKKR